MLKSYLLAPLLALLLLAAPRLAQAQTGNVGIGTTAPDASAALDIVSSSKGVLLPRVANATSIASPAPGLLVYQTGSPVGFYYNAGSAAAPSWQRLSPGDNLGNHTATQALNLNGQKLTGGGTNGLRVRPGGGVQIDTLAGTGQGRLLTVAPDGTLQASAPIQGQALASTASAPQLVGSATTDNSPVVVAVNAAGTRAYVLNNGSNSNTLQAFDVSGSAPVLVGTVATGSAPRSLVLNMSGTRAYVTNRNDQTLQVFDVSGSVPVLLGAAPTGSGPYGVAVNAAGTRAYVLNTGSSTLQPYDVSNDTPVALGSPATTGSGPAFITLNAAGTRAYVANQSNNTFQSFDVSGSGTPVVLSNEATQRPFAVALNRMSTRAYLLSSAGLQTYDISGNGVPVVLGNPVATGNNTRGLAINATGTRAYVTNTSGNTLQAYDLSSGVPVALGSAASTDTSPIFVALNGASTRAYVVNFSSNTLQVFNLGAAPTVVGITSDGSLGTLTLSQLADNLGNHTATQNLDLAGYQLVSGGSTGLALTSAGNAGLGTTSPSQKLEVAGNVKISGSGNGLTFPDGSVQTSASSLSNLVGDVTSSGTTTTYNNVVPAAKGGAGAVNGILKANGSGTVSQAVASDFPTLNQSTTGNAATVTTNANLTGAITSTGNATTYNNVVPAAKGGAGSVSGILKADGAGTVSAAVAGTDYAPAAGSSAYVQNTTTPQASSNFNVSGAGTVGGLLTAGSATLGSATGAVVLPGLSTAGLVTNSASGQLGTTTAASLGTNFVLNQTASQTGANFNVGGNGTVGGSLTAGSASITGPAAVGGSLGVGTSSPAGQLANTANNVIATDGNGISQQGLGWANTSSVGYAGVFYNANSTSNGPGLAVKVASAAAAALDVSQGSSAGTAGTSLLRVNGNGNVGVGTSSPGQKLEVVGNVKISGSGNGLTFADGSVQTSAVNGGSFIQNTTTQQASSNFNISGTGQVGGKLTAGSVAASSSSSISSQGAYLQWNRTGGDGETWLLNQQGGGGANAGIRFGGATTSNGVTEWGRFLTNGNFGLGTTSPAQKLDVAGNANVSGQLTASSATVSGNVGVGLSNPIGGLHIDRPEVGGLSGTLQATALGVVLSGGSSGSPSIELRGDSKTPYIDFAEAANQDYTTRLISQGAVLNVYGVNAGLLLNVRGGLQATSVTQTSDARFKQNVRPLGGALASVLDLRGVRYEWNALGVQRGGTAGAPQVGFLAQELEKVYPELVSTDKDGYKAVNYAQLTPVLLEAIKELAAQNEALKAELQTVKTQATADKAQATATTEAFEARLRRLEAAGAGQAQR